MVGDLNLEVIVVHANLVFISRVVVQVFLND